MIVVIFKIQIATLPPLPTNITDDTTFQNLVSSCHILQIDELNDLQKRQKKKVKKWKL